MITVPSFENSIYFKNLLKRLPSFRGCCIILEISNYDMPPMYTAGKAIEKIAVVVLGIKRQTFFLVSSEFFFQSNPLINDTT